MALGLSQPRATDPRAACGGCWPARARAARYDPPARRHGSRETTAKRTGDGRRRSTHWPRRSATACTPDAGRPWAAGLDRDPESRRPRPSRALPAGAVASTAYHDVEIIVVDNGSTDGSPELAEGFDLPFPLRVLRNTENRSFSDANDQAAAVATGELLLLPQQRRGADHGGLARLHGRDAHDDRRGRGRRPADLPVESRRDAGRGTLRRPDAPAPAAWASTGRAASRCHGPGRRRGPARLPRRSQSRRVPGADRRLPAREPAAFDASVGSHRRTTTGSRTSIWASGFGPPAAASSTTAGQPCGTTNWRRAAAEPARATVTRRPQSRGVSRRWGPRIFRRGVARRSRGRRPVLRAPVPRRDPRRRVRGRDGDRSRPRLGTLSRSSAGGSAGPAPTARRAGIPRPVGRGGHRHRRRLSTSGGCRAGSSRIAWIRGEPDRWLERPWFDDYDIVLVGSPETVATGPERSAKARRPPTVDPSEAARGAAIHDAIVGWATATRYGLRDRDPRSGRRRAMG